MTKRRIRIVNWPVTFSESAVLYFIIFNHMEKGEMGSYKLLSTIALDLGWEMCWYSTDPKARGSSQYFIQHCRSEI